MEAGPASAKKKGSSRLVLQTFGGFGFEGGHLETHGIAPDGSVVDVPLHRHLVSVDFVRLDLEYDHTFRDNWDVWFRLPYEIKRRTADIELLAPATDAELAAIERNREVHHRSATLSGFGDGRALVARRLPNVARGGDVLDIAFGSTLPIGETEEDPFVAGDAGVAHEHIQFGTGTFDPLLEVYYTTPLGRSLSLGAFATGRLSLYENDKTYRGPAEMSLGINTLYRLNGRMALQGGLIGFYQGYAHWDGSRDVNSGLRSLAGSLGVTLAGPGGTQVHLGLRHPLLQETLDAAGDVFEQGPSLLLHVSRDSVSRRRE